MGVFRRRSGSGLGNHFFLRPLFTVAEVDPDIPSLWLWQLGFWRVAVVLIWWRAYGSRLAVIELTGVLRPVPLTPSAAGLAGDRRPLWIARSLDRLAHHRGP